MKILPTQSKKKSFSVSKTYTFIIILLVHTILPILSVLVLERYYKPKINHMQDHVARCNKKQIIRQTFAPLSKQRGYCQIRSQVPVIPWRD